MQKKLTHYCSVLVTAVLMTAMLPDARSSDGVTFIFTSDPQFCGEAVNRIDSCRRWGRQDVAVDWQIAAINRVSENRWPRRWQARLGNGGAFDTPLGIVMGGDLTESAGGFTGRNGGGGQWRMYTTHYERERERAVRYPVYVGLGNHDLEIEPRDRRLPRDLYRDRMWDYVAQRHSGTQAPVPVDSFDPASHAYSWSWGGVHLVQLHRFAGDTRHDLPSSLPWLEQDLQRHASDGRPVILFQHYGFESSNSIGSNSRSRAKWTPAEMQRFAEVIDGYNVIGLFHGHDHWSQPPYRWRGYDVFSPGAAHFGQFAIVHVDQERMDVVYAEVTGETGSLRLVPGSEFSKPVRWPVHLVEDSAAGEAVSEQ